MQVPHTLNARWCGRRVHRVYLWAKWKTRLSRQTRSNWNFKPQLCNSSCNCLFDLSVLIFTRVLSESSSLLHIRCGYQQISHHFLLELASEESSSRTIVVPKTASHPWTNFTDSFVTLLYLRTQDDYGLNFPFVVGAHPRNEVWCPDVLGIEGGTADRVERCAHVPFTSYSSWYWWHQTLQMPFILPHSICAPHPLASEQGQSSLTRAALAVAIPIVPLGGTSATFSEYRKNQEQVR